jgi:hypothetical protein
LLKTKGKNFKTVKGYLHLLQNTIFGKHKIIPCDSLLGMAADNVKPAHAYSLL